MRIAETPWGRGELLAGTPDRGPRNADGGGRNLHGENRNPVEFWNLGEWVGGIGGDGWNGGFAGGEGRERFRIEGEGHVRWAKGIR
jgi:hypothetical protein